MAEPQVERRTSARVAIDGHTLSLVTTSRVRVVEIGLGGALLACPEVPPPATAKLRLKVASVPFASDVEVRYRLRSTGHPDGVHIGATFVGTSPAYHQALEQFLAKAGGRSRG